MSKILGIVKIYLSTVIFSVFGQSKKFTFMRIVGRIREMHANEYIISNVTSSNAFEIKKICN